MRFICGSLLHVLKVTGHRSGSRQFMFHEISRWCGPCPDFREQGGGRLPSYSAVHPRMVQGEHSVSLLVKHQQEVAGHTQPQGPGCCWCQLQPSGSSWHGFAPSPRHLASRLSRSFYSWGPARGLQPGWGDLEKSQAAVRAAGRARRHIQHQPQELLELSSSSRVPKGFSERCHWVRMAALAPLHLPRPTSRYW